MLSSLYEVIKEGGDSNEVLAAKQHFQRLLDVRSSSSAAGLDAMSIGIRMQELAFVAFIRSRLGLPVLRGVDSRCPMNVGGVRCPQLMDKDAIHSSACNRFGAKYARHNAVKYELIRLTSGLVEPAECHFNDEHGGDIHGDILMDDHFGTRSATVIDVSIVEHRGRSGVRPLKFWADRHFATRAREKLKNLKYRSVCRQHGYLFRPFVFSSLGSLGFESRKALQLFAGVVCPAGGHPCRCSPKHGNLQARMRFRSWLIRLAAAFWRGTSWMITKVTKKWIVGARRRGWMAQV